MPARFRDAGLNPLYISFTRLEDADQHLPCKASYKCLYEASDGYCNSNYQELKQGILEVYCTFLFNFAVHALD